MIYDSDSSSNKNDEEEDFTNDGRLAKVKTRIIRGHEDTINTVSFCCNDERILSCSNDGTVRLWQAESGAELVQYEGLHDTGSYISKCCISYDNNRLITSGWDKKVRLTDTETGVFLWTGEHRGIVTDCNFSHDGRLVVSGSDLDRSIRIWDSIGGKMIKEVTDLHTSTITKCMFDSKDVRIITTSMDKTCKFWDMKSGINTITLSAHQNVVSNCCCTENGQLLATCGWDKMIYLWDITTGMYRSKGPKQLEKIHEGCVSAVAFSRDGSLLVSASYDHSILIWNASENPSTVKLKLQGHEDWVTDVSINKQGNIVISASRDNTIRLWDIKESDKIPAAADEKKSVGLRVSTCTMCKKPFSVAMLEESDTTGQNTCVFCRMENRPTIWSIVDKILQPDDEDAIDNELQEDKHQHDVDITIQERETPKIEINL